MTLTIHPYHNHTSETVRADVFARSPCHTKVSATSPYEIESVKCSLKYVPLLNCFLYYLGGIRSEYNTRACFNGEQCESYSMNMGHSKSISASECCDYDLCNGGPFPGRTRAFSHSHSLIEFNPDSPTTVKSGH